MSEGRSGEFLSSSAVDDLEFMLANELYTEAYQFVLDEINENNIPIDAGLGLWITAAIDINNDIALPHSNYIRRYTAAAAAAEGIVLTPEQLQGASNGIASSFINGIIASAGELPTLAGTLEEDALTAVNDLGLNPYDWGGYVFAELYTGYTGVEIAGLTDWSELSEGEQAVVVYATVSALLSARDGVNRLPITNFLINPGFDISLTALGWGLKEVSQEVMELILGQSPSDHVSTVVEEDGDVVVSYSNGSYLVWDFQTGKAIAFDSGEHIIGRFTLEENGVVDFKTYNLGEVLDDPRKILVELPQVGDSDAEVSIKFIDFPLDGSSPETSGQIWTRDELGNVIARNYTQTFTVNSPTSYTVTATFEDVTNPGSPVTDILSMDFDATAAGIDAFSDLKINGVDVPAEFAEFVAPFALQGISPIWQYLEDNVLQNPSFSKILHNAGVSVDRLPVNRAIENWIFPLQIWKRRMTHETITLFG